MNKLYVYSSSGEPLRVENPNNPDEQIRNENHCSMKEPGEETVTYSVTGVPERD
jgi:hypothetical protein